MEKTEHINKQWNEILIEISKKFDDQLDVSSVLLLIGMQKINDLNIDLDKQQKLEAKHVGLCTVLEKYGYYKEKEIDKDGWPHFTQIKKIEGLANNQQELLIKKAIIDYYSFNENSK